MISNSHWGGPLRCKFCGAEHPPIETNRLYAQYPVCPCSPVQGLGCRTWYKPDPGADNWVNDADQIKFMSEFYDGPKPRACTCGAASCKSSIHSPYCDSI